MLHLDRFDIKTGKPIQVDVGGQRQTALKQVEHSYLEHWLTTNNINASFSVARFYDTINDADRLRLEREGKYLAFTSGGEGYFTDSATAQIVTLGSDTVEPIYSGDRNSPHNMVAYGGLISSDGVASTSLPSARLLVIDDEGRTHGNVSLVDANGRAISARQLSSLYDKMGDGTMLVSERITRTLQTAEEREKIAATAAEEIDLSGDITTLAQDWAQADTTVASAEQAEVRLARRSVMQFRAASPDLPGIAKGTLASSTWCNRLGVDAIISVNDIKGADRRLLEPGIKEVGNFWLNRKTKPQRRARQAVGPQVKLTIPKATEAELNPRIQKEAERLAQVSGDFHALSQYYVERKAQRRGISLDEGGATDGQRLDWAYEILTADKYGQLTGEPQLVRKLTRYTQRKWLDLAENGISVPSAVAQHHSQLKPWEVCNKELPHGAIVAYYRSPFPNVAAAAIAINNKAVIQEKDREAFSKEGVAYLSPWTAKEIAITDFDGDRNGFFIGYEATVLDLPQQVRAELASVSALPLDRQYEAGRALFERMVQQVEQGQEARLAPADYPLAVSEFIERNAPEVKLPQVNKQTKQKHSWQEGETRTAATWRAWEITAPDYISKVASAGMTLQALSLEMQYAPPEMKEGLVRQHSVHFEKLLERVRDKEITIPSDDWLTSQGFSPYYEERIEDIAGLGRSLSSTKDSEERSEIVELASQRISELLSDIASGPNAYNLQTAVDMAKSSQGIDQDLHSFVQAVQLKQDAFRANKNKPEVYTKLDKPMPTNMAEPVSENVRAVNATFTRACLSMQTQLPEQRYERFVNLFPDRAPTWMQSSIEQTAVVYNRLREQARSNKSRLRQRRRVDQQPTMYIQTTLGKRFVLQEIEDKTGTLPIWRASGQQPDWKILVSRNEWAFSDKRRFPAQLIWLDSQGKRQVQPIGFVSPKSATANGLEGRLTEGKRLTAASPSVSLRVPFAQQNDTDMLYAQADRLLENALNPPAGQDPEVYRQTFFSELWRSHHSRRKIVMQRGTDLVCDRLQATPELVLMRLQVSPTERQQLIEQKVHTVQFGQDTFPSKHEPVIQPSVSVLTPEGKKLVGAVYERNMALPEGATYMAVMSALKSEKAIGVQIMDLPAVEQTPTEMSALKEGRRHLTFDYEPHAVYGVREGDIVLAQAEEGGEQIALRVGDQHRIDEKLLAKPGAAQRWAEAEKSEQSALFQQLSTATGQGKTLMGLNVEVLGTYERGQIEPFEQSVVEAQPTETVVSVAPLSVEAQPATTVESVSSQSQTASLSAEQLWEGYSQIKGELEALPQLHSSLDWAMASKAIAAGHSPELVQQAIALYSPEAQRSQEPEKYAQEMVDRVDAFVEPVPAQATPSAPSGVMAALARSNPAMKQRLEQAAKELAAEKQPKPAADKQKGKSVGKKQSPARSRSQSRTRSPKKDKGADMGY